MSQQLIEKLKNIILENISDEHFGVTELAEKSGMSRSTLLRKMQKETGKTASKFIRDIRLEKSVEFLTQSELTISEISYEVGFNSTSYYIKCFKEKFGLSPGEYDRSSVKTLNDEGEDVSDKKILNIPHSAMWKIGVAVIVIIISAVTLWILVKPEVETDKSIAVLPFKNDSGDSSNIYIANGLMDAVLNNLQKIKDLKVISRTSVEKYRNSNLTIPEIAKELNVTYFVEGSAQKIDNNILLNIKLVDGKNDRHMWSEQYDRKLDDVFDIQREVASKIAHQVEANITPLEQQRLNEIPTRDMVAYEYFLKGLDLLQHANEENLNKAIPLFTKAIERDENFARAYAAISMAYYYLDIFQYEKKHIKQINYYAEKAYLIDPQLTQSLVAKALSYMIKQDYKTAVTYFEKALEYHPNSAFVLNFLSDFYTNYIPNTEKYLEYALRGMQLDKSQNDSTANSYLYLHLANAFMQNGFLMQAQEYINKSLDFNSNNIYSMYVKVYIHYAETKDINRTNEDLLKIYAIDTTRLDVIQEVAKSFYFKEDYQNAYKFYNKLLKAREEQNIYLFLHEDVKIAWTYKQLGYDGKSDSLIKQFRNYINHDKSIYKGLMMTEYYTYKGEYNLALDALKKFSEQNSYHIWTLFLPYEPYFKELGKKPEFIDIMKSIRDKFDSRHKRLEKHLKEENLI